MDKGGWQIASGVLAMALIGAGFALVANTRALEQATEDLKAAKTVETVTVHEVHRPQCPDSPPAPQLAPGEVVPWPATAKCMGGRLIDRTQNGWESVTHNGRPVLCRE